MLVRRLKDCPPFSAGDGSVLREPLNALKGDFDFRYSLAQAVLAPGARTKPHKLRTSEVYYMLEGTARVYLGDRSYDVAPDDTVYIPAHTVQFVENTGKCELKFLCIVDPAWRPEDEEIL